MIRLKVPSTKPGQEDCRDHRSAALDLLEDPQGQRLDPAVMDALRACGRCRAEVEDLLLGSYAIGRAWQSARLAEPPDTTWPGLRDRVRRPRGDALRGRVHVLGIGMSAVLVALLSSSQLGAALQPGGGAALAEPTRTVPVERRYDPPARSGAVSIVPAPETLLSTPRLPIVPSRKVTRTIADDRPSARDAPIHASHVKPARPQPAMQAHPVTL